jgi:hypothetical protein
MWQKEGHNLHLMEKCSVCLEHQPNIELLCGHVYHLKCIMEVLNRRMNCPMCRSERFDSAKIFCHSCLVSSVHIPLENYVDQLGGQRLICESCKDATSAGELVRQ